MRLEHIPIILGVLVCLIAAGIMYDAATPETLRPYRERRRRVRAEPNTPGEWMVGLGMLCLGAALIARDTWRWSTIVMFAGVALLVAGAILNRAYFREMLLFRGAARRGADGEGRPKESKEPEPRLRIR